MKFTSLFLASALIFIFTFTSPSLSFATSNNQEYSFVFDIEGFSLKIGQPYYIRPLHAVDGSYVDLQTNVTGNTCTTDVIQQVNDFLPRTPFTFTPASPQWGIFEGFPLAISSPGENECEGSTIWKVKPLLGTCLQSITTGGEFNTSQSCFRIINSESSESRYVYMIEYTPNSCGEGAGDINSYPIRTNKCSADDFRRLYIGSSISNEPFKVTFVKQPLDVI